MLKGVFAHRRNRGATVIKELAIEGASRNQTDEKQCNKFRSVTHKAAAVLSDILNDAIAGSNIESAVPI
jgi:hypothetical protein